jgi:hypothetical protein
MSYGFKPLGDGAYKVTGVRIGKDGKYITRKNPDVQNLPAGSLVRLPNGEVGVIFDARGKDIYTGLKFYRWVPIQSWTDADLDENTLDVRYMSGVYAVFAKDIVEVIA